MNIRMEEMRDLAHYFGRTAFQKEVADQYEAIINKWSQSLFDKVIKHCRDSEHITDFPKPFEMDRIGIKLYHNTKFHGIEYDDCYYCDSTGFVPSLVYYEIYQGNPVVQNYTCKCSAGKIKNFGVPYFDKFGDIEFTERIEGYSYPQIVNKEYHRLLRLSKEKEGKNNVM